MKTKNNQVPVNYISGKSDGSIEINTIKRRWVYSNENALDGILWLFQNRFTTVDDDAIKNISIFFRREIKSLKNKVDNGSLRIFYKWRRTFYHIVKKQRDKGRLVIFCRAFYKCPESHNHFAHYCKGSLSIFRDREKS